ncbi:hypothetical protein [Bartonella bilalgolemii]|uniref:hypothetical protein n=1 Tax=Bartonella bilalgolemii TaxID=2942911 RepID=UPI0039084271
MIGKLKGILEHVFNHYMIRAEFDSSDAADALAFAICHSAHRTSSSYRLKASA